jgi:hypothetical protein
MARYLLAYRGGSMPESHEERDAVMAAWGAWFERLGAAVADPGNPSSRAATIAPDGSTTAGPASLSGYSIIAADNLDQAVELGKGCPVLAGGASVEVIETFEAM